VDIEINVEGQQQYLPRRQASTGKLAGKESKGRGGPRWHLGDGYGGGAGEDGREN
jgi:hypothetical protein